jgi:outer membrane murein-binding lipoprotein Lpp
MRALSSRRTDAPHGSPRGWVRAVAAGLLPCLLLAGCYNQVPLPAQDPAPSTRVVVHLGQGGSDEVARQLGPGVVAVEGDVSAVRPDAIDLFVRNTQAQNGGSTPWNGEPVTIPRSAVTSVELRTLNRTRSFLLAGAIVAGTLLVARLLGGVVFDGDGGGGGGPVPPQ